MITLDTTTRSLEIVLGEAATTQLPWIVTYADNTATTYTVASSNGATNSTTIVSMVAAPAASTQRQIKLLSLSNADNVSHVVTIQLNDNTTLRTIIKLTVAAGETLMYTDGQGFVALTSTGAIKTTTTATVSPGPMGPAVFLEAEQGEQGETGPAGVNGPPGATGSTGAQGPVGPAIFLVAEPGEDGQDGRPGLSGTNGAIGSVGPAGPAIFLVAEPGEDGADGPVGSTGPAGSNGTQTQVEIDFGSTATDQSTFTITDALVSGTSKIMAVQAFVAATSKEQDENEFDVLQCQTVAGTGNFTLVVSSLYGPVSGTFKINYWVA